ncbi:MAG: aldehyde dehydrogenase family protein [Blastocatellia bacterium]|nr:aldehyde dehydrogenase family protein [Blastocatellia bacterium]MBL8193294.1 aldehyde dehydrogenase family protein [Blastocatellia bacterium]MBN8722149.1 aldehyde dehydrogenase family protein [Acidobacteriota bacterium]
MVKDYPLLIAGERETSSEQIEIRSPFNGELIGTTYQATPNQINRAIALASEAFRLTRRLPTYRRVEVLLNAAAEVRKRSEEISRLIALEAGKPIKAARIEVARAANTLTLAAEEAKRLNGEVLPLDLDASSQGRMAIVRRFPIGLMTAITPFNFPLNLAVHKLAPAVAIGCPFILKPAPQTPLTGLVLGEILLNAGWPAQALSVLACRNEDANPLVVDPRVKILSFTGSVAVGWQLKKAAFDRRVVLELGGNAGVAVHSDADLDFAISRCVAGGFGYAGQVCISVQRIYVHSPIYQEFTDKFLNLTKTLKIGNPLDEQTDLGPMISEKEATRAESWIKEALDHNAKLLCGGSRSGNIFQPTVLTNVDPELKVQSQEIFAPVVTLTPYETFDEAIEMIDKSSFGLQAGIFTQDIKAIFQAYERLEVGGLIVRDIPTYRAETMPYGGVKDSGFGREGIRYAIEEMTELKTLVLNLD